MIPLFKVYMSKNSSESASKVINSGYIGQGPVVDKFEDMLKERLDNDLVLTTNSGTSALHLSLHTIGKPGDEVLCTPLTCTATNWPVLANGMGIKWVDLDPNTLNMDLDDLSRKITKTTKIILVVHWGGYPLDLCKLDDVCEKAKKINGFKPLVIEDCAHAFGSTYNERCLGNHGNIACYSFQAIKHLTSVDGGLICCPNIELYNKMKLTRWYGIDREADRKDFRCEANISNWGFKFHMNDVNAAVGIENLKEVDKEVIEKHVDNAEYYNRSLEKVRGVELLENKPDRQSSNWLYTIKIQNRDKFIHEMKRDGITTSRVHERNDIHTCVDSYRCLLPELDRVVKNVVCIPCGWWLSSEEREHIVKCIKKYTKSL